ncbi:aldehyde dehydrogenase (NAD(+)) [Paraburkholderia kururiensis]|uniref:L-piperidine-6-carboxylate dehydrogenase n=1 Tax=Paraburkholderia kururiensis TaxID=984307 RepID=UPI0039A6AF93
MKRDVLDSLARLGADLDQLSDGDLPVRTPVTGEVLCNVRNVKADSADEIVTRSVAAFRAWRSTPAPIRGELIRLLGEELRAAKNELGKLISIETGKILQEGLGEVQEMIDICDFAVGLSRQLYGLTIASERPGHRMSETWHPIGPCLVVTAFNFPAAVWAWNAALALVCGDSVVWKPSEKTPLTALAVQGVFKRSVARFGRAPTDLNLVAVGERDLGERLVADARIPLISATGSTRMGRAIAKAAAPRFARTILELGGNNASVVCPSADLELVKRAVAFAAVGTAGQRCTSLRRLIVHESVYDKVVSGVTAVYQQLRIGNPLEASTMVGPLIDEAAFVAMQQAVTEARGQGGTVSGGGRVTNSLGEGAYYVHPAIVEMPSQSGIMKEETFAPILYVMPYRNFDDAIELVNGTSYGLSSSIFTNDLRETERFLSAVGSDAGIANVNMGPSGAEIGGAFGGEKDTGGGRESGSDAWKGYMRRSTNTINYSVDLPLAQGIRFDV